MAGSLFVADGQPTPEERLEIEAHQRAKEARLKARRAEEARKAARREAALSNSSKDPQASLKADAFSTQPALIKNPYLKYAVGRTHNRPREQRSPFFRSGMEMTLSSIQSGSYLEPEEDEKLRDRAIQEQIVKEHKKHDRVRKDARVHKKVRVAKREAIKRLKSYALEDLPELDPSEDLESLDWEDMEQGMEEDLEEGFNGLDELQMLQIRYAREVEVEEKEKKTVRFAEPEVEKTKERVRFVDYEIGEPDLGRK